MGAQRYYGNAPRNVLKEEAATMVGAQYTWPRQVVALKSIAGCPSATVGNREG